VERVLEDVQNGYVSAAAAREQYGVALTRTDDSWQLDADETARLRQR
jgi:hypothetical protein